jgi:hypothetical protein
MWAAKPSQAAEGVAALRALEGKLDLEMTEIIVLSNKHRADQVVDVNASCT